MSTYINNNTTAFQATNNLNANSSNLSRDIQRLSTGLRINSAADDPAGLVISENLAAQVSGVTQATANSNDAINEIKTAEGALNQVQSLLISIRQLAVHASNLGVNDSTDVQADQTQIASAIESINQISATTQFGTKKLLDGSATTAGTTTAGSAVYSGGSSNFSVAAQGIYSASSVVPAGSFSNFVANAATSTTLVSNAVGSNANYFQGSLSINGATYNVGSSGSNVNLNGLNQAIASSGYTASIASNGALTLTSSNTGAASTTPTANFSGLSQFATTTGTTAAATYSAAVNGGAITATGNAVNAGTFGTVSSAVGTGVVTGDAFSGSFILNGNTVTVAAASTIANIQTAVRALGTVGGVNYSTYTAAITGNKLVLTDGTKQNEASTADFSGLTDTTQGVTFAAAPSTSTAGVAPVAAVANKAVASYNGTSPYVATGATATTFGGAIKIDGTSYTIGTAGSTNNTLAALNTAINASGYVATADASGNLTLTSATTLNGETYDLSGLSTYSPGNSTSTGGYSSVLAGKDGSLTFSDAATAGGTTTIASTGSSVNGTTATYTFANGLALQLASAPTSGFQAVTGTVNATAGVTTHGQNLNYQIGANEGQTSTISIQSTAASQLGLNTGSYTDTNGDTQTVSTDSVADLNVTTFKGAQDAIAVIDNAISQVSTLRANLGAFQTNVLQSNVTSLGVDSTNLQASQSSVQDADLASTVTEYTKDSILVQSATSALSYANQSPQYLLKLLQ